MRYPDWQEPVLDALIEQSLIKTRIAEKVVEAKIAESPKVGVEYAALLDAERVLNVCQTAARGCESSIVCEAHSTENMMHLPVSLQTHGSVYPAHPTF